MTTELGRLIAPRDGTTYLFFGGKGGVGKTTMATATATRLADSGYETTIISTDPTVSLGAMYGQEVAGVTPVPVPDVPGLSALTINPNEARGAFQSRVENLTQNASQSTLGSIIAAPCAAEMAAFDAFVGFLEEPRGDVVVFDTAPTGTTLRELAMPFDWAGFLQKQITESHEVARLMGLNADADEALAHDKQRYEKALQILRDRDRTIFTLVLTPERLPLEETQSAASGLAGLGIWVQSLVINQVIEDSVIEGNRFLAARSAVQHRYLDTIDAGFPDLVRARLPLLDRDVSDITTLRHLTNLLYGEPADVVRQPARMS